MSYHPKSASDGSHAGGEVTAVVLGWLGAVPKHLRRYSELYTSKGINAVTFVVPAGDVLWFDLGKSVEDRIRELANELASWLYEGRERCLIFHTFSSTGWLVYGVLLGHLQERPDLMGRIRGCIIDSGGDPEINPKVWAAGFTAALLKKRNTVTNQLGEHLLKIEAVLLLALEKIFALLAKLPDAKRRLSTIISRLSENQPPCPQLYLYSTADKVIPSRAVRSFIEDQRMKGRAVWSFNFQTSSHVDHYRTFPDAYSSQINRFLTALLVTGKQ